jgi:hypothetical protein
MQFDQIQSVSGFVEFGPLVKASGQNVPRNQLKNAVIKTIDILISSDPTDRSTGILLNLYYRMSYNGRASLCHNNNDRIKSKSRQSDIQEFSIVAPQHNGIQDIY